MSVFEKGKIVLCHRIKQCPQCKRRYEFEELNRLLPPHKQYASDAIVTAGRSRFCDHKQDGEIVARVELAVTGG